jgi:hypothetical protein
MRQIGVYSSGTFLLRPKRHFIDYAVNNTSYIMTRKVKKLAGPRESAAEGIDSRAEII